MVKAISLPYDIPNASDRHLIELEKQVQRLMEAHLALKASVQVNKIASSCEIYSGPHDTQYCMENLEQAFVNYASSRTDEAGVSSARSYPIKDPQSSSNSFKSANAIKTCSKPTNNFQKDQPQVKTLTVNKIGTPKPKELEKALEDEFKDLHLKLAVLKVLAHAPMYNAIFDKYVESLEL
ncbi:hypothetical protein Tco_1195404, partial [Tanacetum coccineum]